MLEVRRQRGEGGRAHRELEVVLLPLERVHAARAARELEMAQRRNDETVRGQRWSAPLPLLALVLLEAPLHRRRPRPIRARGHGRRRQQPRGRPPAPPRPAMAPPRRQPALIARWRLGAANRRDVCLTNALRLSYGPH